MTYHRGLSRSGALDDFSGDELDWKRERPTAVQREILRADAARVQFSRNWRRKELDSEILGEPAWDILLALFVVDNDRRRLSVTELAKMTQTPPTTALRWVAVLENRELVRRRQNPFDQRVVHVELTDKGRRSMESYFMRLREAAIFGSGEAVEQSSRSASR